jgi:hypothetical protein
MRKSKWDRPLTQKECDIINAPYRKETSYERAMREAKEQYEKEIAEQNRLTVRKFLDNTLPEQTNVDA